VGDVLLARISHRVPVMAGLFADVTISKKAFLQANPHHKAYAFRRLPNGSVENVGGSFKVKGGSGSGEGAERNGTERKGAEDSEGSEEEDEEGADDVPDDEEDDVIDDDEEELPLEEEGAEKGAEGSEGWDEDGKATEANAEVSDGGVTPFNCLLCDEEIVVDGL
jgi:hypothetical protein